MTDFRRTAQWQRVRAEVLAGATHCALCKSPLDFAAQPRSMWSPEVDHIGPIAQGGPFDPANLQPVHYGCNSRAAPIGNRSAKRRHSAPRGPRSTPRAAWW